jgi:hypothetical protein
MDLLMHSGPVEVAREPLKGLVASQVSREGCIMSFREKSVTEVAFRHVEFGPLIEESILVTKVWPCSTQNCFSQPLILSIGQGRLLEVREEVVGDLDPREGGELVDRFTLVVNR